MHTVGPSVSVDSWLAQPLPGHDAAWRLEISSLVTSDSIISLFICPTFSLFVLVLDRSQYRDNLACYLAFCLYIRRPAYYSGVLFMLTCSYTATRTILSR